MIEIYVGETKDKLHKQIWGHISDFIVNVNNIVYQHFNQSDHSIFRMSVHIIETIQHRTNNSNVATTLLIFNIFFIYVKLVV